MEWLGYLFFTHFAFFTVYLYLPWIVTPIVIHLHAYYIADPPFLKQKHSLGLRWIGVFCCLSYMAYTRKEMNSLVSYHDGNVQQSNYDASASCVTLYKYTKRCPTASPSRKKVGHAYANGQVRTK